MMDMNINRNRGTKTEESSASGFVQHQIGLSEIPYWLFSLDSNFKTTFSELQNNAKCVLSVRRAAALTLTLTLISTTVIQCGSTVECALNTF